MIFIEMLRLSWLTLTSSTFHLVVSIRDILETDMMVLVSGLV